MTARLPGLSDTKYRYPAYVPSTSPLLPTCEREKSSSAKGLPSIERPFHRQPRARRRRPPCPPA
ncbi:hypothetical protein, partial [Eggerthella sinensis]|uniref:hypothetical protein n=1 Tax=Eggerthella sinensis TaxID=242230 RepID=UPI0022DFF25E